MEKMSYNDWIEKAKELYGEDSYNWKFKCPSCGHIQSVNSMLKNNPLLKAKNFENSIYFNCEGRTNEKYGCGWSLGGLFHIHKLEVDFKGENVPVFEFAIK